MKKFIYLILFSGVFLFLNSCENKKLNTIPVNLEVLKNWGENIIVPSYKNYQSEVAVLVNDAKKFKTNRTQENLDNLKKSWLKAYDALQKTLIFGFIKSAQNTYLVEMANTYPTNPNSINKNIELIQQNRADEILLDPTYAEVQRTYQGFPALDYLLFSKGHTLDYFKGTKGDSVCTYMVILTEVLQKNINYVVNDWNIYIDDYINDADGSSNGAYAVTINSFIKAYEKSIRAEKVGYAGGFIPSQGGKASPEIIEAYYNGNVSKKLLTTALKSSEDFFNGKHFGKNSSGKSLYWALEDLNQKSYADQINEQYQTIYKAIESTPQPLKETAISDNKQMQNIYMAMQKNVAYYKTYMLAILNVSVGYVDNDGD